MKLKLRQLFRYPARRRFVKGLRRPLPRPDPAGRQRFPSPGASDPWYRPMVSQRGMPHQRLARSGSFPHRPAVPARRYRDALSGIVVKDTPKNVGAPAEVLNAFFTGFIFKHGRFLLMDLSNAVDKSGILPICALIPTLSRQFGQEVTDTAAGHGCCEPLLDVEFRRPSTSRTPLSARWKHQR